VLPATKPLLVMLISLFSYLIYPVFNISNSYYADRSIYTRKG